MGAGGSSSLIIIVKIRILYIGPRYVLQRTSPILPPLDWYFQLNLTHLPSFLLLPLTPPCSPLSPPMALLMVASLPISVTCWRQLPAAVILGALVPPSPSPWAFCCLSEAPAVIRRHHHLCSRVTFTFFMSLIASPPSLPGQCSLSLTWGSAAQNCTNLYFNWDGDEAILDKNTNRHDDVDGDINTIYVVHIII